MATMLFRQHMSALGGGGGSVLNKATADSPEVVVAFYEERLGATQHDAATGSAKWHIEDAPNGMGGGQHLEIWPVAGAYPFKGAQGSHPPPPDARTVIHQSYLYTPLKDPPDAMSPARE